MRGKTSALIYYFKDKELITGVVLLCSAVVSFWVTNSVYSDVYEGLKSLNIGIEIGDIKYSKDLFHWVNDGLMVLFFFLVGLELKYEFYYGHLTSVKKAIYPFICALGGMIVPAIIFYAYNHDQAYAMRGWAIPTATDIAFSLAVLSLFSRSLPKSVRIFLLALAIFDDLGAIGIIAFFYANKINVLMFSSAVSIAMIMKLLGVFKIEKSWYYHICFGLMWWFVLNSGVHATMAGVVAAWLYPTDTKKYAHKEGGYLHHLLDKLSPFVNYTVLPFFAFLNAGFQLSILESVSVFSSVSLGIMLGLFVGKPLGIFVFGMFGEWLKIANRPHGLQLTHLLAVGFICGIGFTMSLFIGDLAYDPNTLNHYDGWCKIGVMFGSLASALVGIGLLMVKKTSVDQEHASNTKA